MFRKLKADGERLETAIEQRDEFGVGAALMDFSVTATSLGEWYQPDVRKSEWLAAGVGRILKSLAHAYKHAWDRQVKVGSNPGELQLSLKAGVMAGDCRVVAGDAVVTVDGSWTVCVYDSAGRLVGSVLAIKDQAIGWWDARLEPPT